MPIAGRSSTSAVFGLPGRFASDPPWLWSGFGGFLHPGPRRGPAARLKHHPQGAGDEPAILVVLGTTGNGEGLATSWEDWKAYYSPLLSTPTLVGEALTQHAVGNLYHI